MKTFLSLLMAALFFVVQTVTFSHVSIAQDQSTFSSEDLRVQIADQIENQGKYYQDILDREGEEAADKAFLETFERNFKELSQAFEGILIQIDEEEATHHIKTLTSALPISQSETAMSLLTDRSKTNKEKLETLFKSLSLKNLETALKEALKKVHESGYEKMFTGLADQVRSRTPDSEHKEPWWPYIVGGLLVGVGFLLFIGGFTGMILSFTYLPNFTEFILVLIGSMAAGAIGGSSMQGGTAIINYYWFGNDY